MMHLEPRLDFIGIMCMANYFFKLRPLQLNFLFLGPVRPIKFVNEMFLFIFEDHVFDRVSLWYQCTVGHSYLLCMG